MFDAHVHVGYYSRQGMASTFYYSPKRIIGILNRSCIEEFVVSSTCAQVRGLSIADIVREAREVKRLAGERAHVFFWLSGHLYDEDRTLSWIETGLFDGVKFHECETPWMRKRKDELVRVVEVVSRHGLAVQFHSGGRGPYDPRKLAEIARRFPNTRFDFAHCIDMEAMSNVMAQCPNVWSDTAYLQIDEFKRLTSYDWHGRLMFGSDLPVWQAHEDVSLTRRYREYTEAYASTGIDGDAAFRSYLCRTIE